MGAIPLLPTVPLTVTVTATMGAIPLLPTALPTVTVAATMVVATITTPIAVQAVPPCGQRRPLQLILQAPRHTALLPMARAPPAGATVVTITTVCNVSSLSQCLLCPCRHRLVLECMSQYGSPSSMNMPPASPPSGSGSGNGATHTVIVAPTQGVLRYVPFALNASVGDTVMFMWGANNHTVTKSSELEVCNKTSDSPFASGEQNEGFMCKNQIRRLRGIYSAALI